VEAKRIVRAEKLAIPASPEREELVSPPAPETRKPRWKFVKLSCVGQELVFKDGTSFTFPLRQRQDRTFHPNSEYVTEDEKLAENLRQLPAGYGVVEVQAK
jgi:hypothetical protein